MSEEISKLPPRAFGSIIDMLKALRGEDGKTQDDLLAAIKELQVTKPALSKRLHKIALAQRAAIAKAEGKS